MSGLLLVPDLALEHWAGVDRYAAGLVGRLPEAAWPEEAAAIQGPRYLARYGLYPLALARYRPALVHVLDHSYAHCLSSFPGIPSVVTVHDFQPLRELAQSGRSLRIRLRDRLLAWVMGWARRADRLIAVSGFTAFEACRVLELPPERVRVVPHAVDESFLQRPADGVVAARRCGWVGQGSRTVVLLHVGSCVPRKNVEAAIRTLALLRQGGADARLVQIGGRFSFEQRAAIDEDRLGPFVRQEPSVTEDALVAAYAAADVVILPATYEGFCLPALEAMAVGAPLVTSGAGAIAEVVGDAAVIVEPPDARGLADGVQRLLSDSALRADLVARGRQRARRRTWADVVAETRAVYAELLPDP